MSRRKDIEKLFKMHYAPMYRLALLLLHDDDLARDIVHDVFATLLDREKQMIPTIGYLLRAVRNRALNYIRDCEIHQRVTNMLFVENQEYEVEEWPDEAVVSRIYDLIRNDISSQSRRVIDLRFSEGKPFAEIAEIMGISKSAVFKHLSNALIIIRKKLDKNG